MVIYLGCGPIILREFKDNWHSDSHQGETVWQSSLAWRLQYQTVTQSLPGGRRTVSGVWDIRWPPISWVVGLNIFWDCLVSQCSVGSCDQWELPPFCKATDSYLSNPQWQAKAMRQWDSETVYFDAVVLTRGAADTKAFFSFFSRKSDSHFKKWYFHRSFNSLRDKLDHHWFR